MLPSSAGRCALLLCALLLSCQLGYAQQQQQPSLYGAGTSLVKGDVTQIMNVLMSQARPSVWMGYRNTNTPVAIDEFISVLGSGTGAGSNFLVSGMPVPTANYTSGMLQVPLALAKVAIWHSVPGSNYTGALNMTQCLLAKIMSSGITTWDHPDVLAVNPNLKVPAGTRITVIGAPDVSPTVFSMSNWIQWGCAPAASPWTMGASLQVPVSSWPAGTAIVPSVEVQLKMLSPVDPTYRPYCLTLMDYAAGARNNKIYEANLTDMAVQLGNGSFVTTGAASNAIVGAALTATPAPNFPTITDNWDVQSFKYALFNGSLTSGWPMTIPLMMMVPQNVTGFGTQGALLSAFLRFALSSAGQAIVAANNHVPLPADVRTALLSQLSSQLIISPDAQPWYFEPNATGPGLGSGDFVFSSYRDTYLSQQAAMVDQLQKQVAALMQRVVTLESVAVLAAADRAAAAVDRGRISAAVDDIAETEAKVATANNIAIAGVVLAVALAVAALIVAAVYIVRTKKLDQKYSKYLPLGVKARFDDTPENL